MYERHDTNARSSRGISSNLPQFFFSSPLQTQRSIAAARGETQFVQEVTARNHYDNYLRGGGTPIGSDGTPGSARSVTDPGFGSAACNCTSAKPCCIEELQISCEHKTGRITYPTPLMHVTAGKPCQVVFVADNGGGSGRDTVRFTPKKRPPAGCGMQDQTPELRIVDRDPRPGVNMVRRKLDGPASWNAEYWTGSTLGIGDFPRFFNVTWKTVFGKVEDLRQEYGVSVASCSGRSDMNFMAHVYPKVQWKSSDMSARLEGSFFTNGSFQFAASLSGKIEGVFGGSAFSLSATPSSKGEVEQNAKSMIPFMDRAIARMQSLTRQGARVGDPDNPTTYSSIKARHSVSFGKSTFKVAEDPADHTEVGSDAEIFLGYDPFCGITAALDLIDSLLTAANSVTPGFANVVRKGREAAARGIGDHDGSLHLRAHAAGTLSIAGDLGKGGVTLIRRPGQRIWTGRGEVGGSTEMELAGVIRGDGKAYIMQGTFSGEDRAKSKLTAGLKTLPPASQTGPNAGKAEIKVEWDGIKVTYSAQVQATVIGISAGRKNEGGEILICPKAELYKNVI